MHKMSIDVLVKKKRIMTKMREVDGNEKVERDNYAKNPRSYG